MSDCLLHVTGEGTILICLGEDSLAKNGDLL